jgi:Flp pilus assembly pilin Flp
MQSINELSVQAYIAVQSFFHDAVERLRNEEEGQTAVEYAGIIALLAVIFGAIFALNLHTTISEAIRDAVKTITSPSGGGGGE